MTKDEGRTTKIKEIKTRSKIREKSFFSHFLINFLHQIVHYEPKKCLRVLHVTLEHSNKMKWSAGSRLTAQKAA